MRQEETLQHVVHCYQPIHQHSRTMNLVVFGALLCLAFAVTEGSARWCYTCTSKRDLRCADPFHSNVSFMQHQCTEDSSHSMHMHHMHHMKPVCKKSVRMVHGEEVVLRSCEWDEQTACPSTVDGSSEEIFCGTCSTDGCNSATPTTSSSIFQCFIQIFLWALLMRFLRWTY